MEKLFTFLEEEYRPTSIVDIKEKHLNHFIRNFGKSVTKREDSFSAVQKFNNKLSSLKDIPEKPNTEIKTPGRFSKQCMHQGLE